ncbi:MAG: hypothetical protein KJ634_00550 [Gammaproteobacteria bacterium]|nr:hypothetical protein [Gammaproteobacteria bacterium]MBU1414089.1 hypothetical protein [Gammaproteobacteria bacterium]
MLDEYGRSLGKSARRYVAFLCRGYLALSFLGLQLAGCTSPLKLPRYEAQGVGAYVNRQVQGDVRVAVQPITDAEEQRKYFGVVLTDAGVLPVLIVVEDHSSSRRFLIRDDLIVMRAKSTNQVLAKPMLQDMSDAPYAEPMHKVSAATSTSAVAAGDVALLAGNTVAAAGAFVFALPAVLMAVGVAKNAESAAIIQNNLFDNTLFTKTVMPNKSISGFAYFKAADGKLDFARDDGKVLDDLILRLQAADMDSETRYDFEFRM